MNIKREQFGVSTSICAGEVRRIAKEVGNLSQGDLVRGYIDLLEDFARFVLQHGFGTIEIELGFSVLSADQLHPMVKPLKGIISPFQTVCCHLPLGEINISALNLAVRREAIEETKRHIDLCEELEIKKLVMHPGSFTAMPDRYSMLPDQTREIAGESILDIFSYCEKKSMELSLENLHRNEPLFREPDEFEPFVRKGIGIVLDTVHAFTSGVDPLDFITHFGKQVTEVHLTDGTDDDPFSDSPIGMGLVDCLAVLRKLEEEQFRGVIILEVLSKEALMGSKTFLEENAYLT